MRRRIFRTVQSRPVSSHSVPFSSHPISLCLDMSHLFPYRQSRFIPSHLVPLCLILSRLVSSRVVSSHFVCFVPFRFVPSLVSPLVPFRLIPFGPLLISPNFPLSRPVPSVPISSRFTPSHLVPFCIVLYGFVPFRFIPSLVPPLVPSRLVPFGPLLISPSFPLSRPVPSLPISWRNLSRLISCHSVPSLVPSHLFLPRLVLSSPVFYRPVPSRLVPLGLVSPISFYPILFRLFSSRLVPSHDSCRLPLSRLVSSCRSQTRRQNDDDDSRDKHLMLGHGLSFICLPLQEISLVLQEQLGRINSSGVVQGEVNDVGAL